MVTNLAHSPEAFAAGTGTGEATFDAPHAAGVMQSKQPGRTQAAIMTGQSEGPKAINLKVKEALKVLNVSRTTLYRAWLEGWGPDFFWVGRSRRIPLQAALNWRGRPAEVAGGE